MLSFSLFVFFVKQKTAYEVRISDWSSDVCSSDLGRRGNASGDGIGDWGFGIRGCGVRRCRKEVHFRESQIPNPESRLPSHTPGTARTASARSRARPR